MNPELSCELLELLPPVYREVRDYQQICTAEKVQFEHLADGIRRVQDNFFIQTMDEDSVSRWEQVFHIRARPSTETLTFRRQRVLARLRTRPPFTLGFLYQQLDELIGAGQWTCDVNYPAYTLTIGTDLERRSAQSELLHLVNQIKPAHIAFHPYFFYEPSCLHACLAAIPCSTSLQMSACLPKIEVASTLRLFTAPIHSVSVQASATLPKIMKEVKK